MNRAFLLLSFTVALPAVAQIPAFPGAEGYGAYAKGGRGGDVYHVTNLNYSGVGSFADAIATVPAAGRTIVFDISGHIHVNKTTLAKSNVTIAGQTAPGDGIGFKDGTFIITGDDIVIRHARFRYGAKAAGGDCINLSSGTLNAILDHVSLQFSTDENISSFSSPPENLTMQWSLNGWGLESHSCGGLWDQNHASSHHSLWAHNHTRNPKARPNGLLEWVNNITFDWDIGFIMGDSNSNASWKSNVRGCYFLCPPGNLRNRALEKAGLQTSNGLPNFSLYLDNCLHDADGDGLLNGTDKGYGIASGSYNTSPTPFPGSAAGIVIDPPLLAFKKVLSKAGAQRLDVSYAGDVHDEVDAKMVGNVLSQTRNHISKESSLGLTNGGFGTLNSAPAPVDTDRDGMPDYYENALGWNPAVQDHNTAMTSSGGIVTGTTFFPAGTVAGYTRLEEYLHFLASPHGTLAKNIAGSPTSIQVDLRKFTKGFVKSPVFVVSNPLNGATTQSGAGNSQVTFTPAVNHVGRARFDFKVTDADGTEWTQTCLLLVSSSGLPRDLSWKGDGTTNVWDGTANNWLKSGAPIAFSSGDRVTFDDAGSLSPAVSIVGSNTPSTVEVNSVGNYTFAGSGAITATGSLTKRGPGTLTIRNTGTNAFSAATLDEGTLTLANEMANASGLGTGPLTLNSGTVNVYDAGAGGSFTGTLPNPLVIKGDVALNAGARSGASGALSGAGTLHLFVPYIRTDWGGNPAQFAGTLDVITDADGGDFRINNGGSGAVTDYGAARILLADKVSAYYLPNPPSTGDKTQTVQIGELATSGTGSGVTLGGANGAPDRTVLWKIGALNTSSTFAGALVNRTGPAALSKTGSGTLTLTGASSATGPTTISAGILRVNGSLGATATTVASGATLAGAGSIGGLTALQAGAIIAPGASPGARAPFTIGGGFSATSGTFQLDLSNDPAGINDKILVTGGTSTLAGANTFQINFSDGTLGAGDYKLVECAPNVAFGVVSGTTLSLGSVVPSGTRQTFALNRSGSGTMGGNVRLTVTGNAADLLWTGALAGATWDLNTTANFTGASPGKFYNLDAVTFEDSSANKNVTLTGSLAPRSTTVTTAGAYTFSGAGTLDGVGSLVKNGTGILTLAGTAGHTFSGGVTLNAGAIVLGNDTANAAGLGTGSVELHGGVISMHDNSATYNSFFANLVIPAGKTARLNADSRVDVYGTLSGAGTLDFQIPFVRTTLFADWSAFTGVVNVLTNTGGGDFRMGTSYGFPGFPQATLVLNDKTHAYYTGTLAAGAGTTIEIGGLAGTPLSTLQGGPTGGRALTYRIGGKNGDATFAGVISEQNTGTATNYVKTGTGTWTLSGSGTWNGGTTVEQGTLELRTGSFSSESAVNVANGAALNIAGATLATDVVNLDTGASMTAFGALVADLNSNGVLEGRGYSEGTPSALAITGSAFFDASSVLQMRVGAASDLLTIGGDLSLAGTVRIALSAGTGFGRYPLISYTGTLQPGMPLLAGIPSGTTAQLSAAVPGRIELVIDDSDEDGLPDSWETVAFGNLAQGPADDSDGDGQSNATEYLAGTLPNDASSRFAVTLLTSAGNQLSLAWPSIPGRTYAVESATELAGSWSELVTLPAAPAPLTTTNYQVTPVDTRRFFRIGIRP